MKSNSKSVKAAIQDHIINHLMFQEVETLEGKINYLLESFSSWFYPNALKREKTYQKTFQYFSEGLPSAFEPLVYNIEITNFLESIGLIKPEKSRVDSIQLYHNLLYRELLVILRKEGRENEFLSLFTKR